MAVYVLKDCKHWIGAYMLSDEIHATSISAEVENQDVTTFGSGGAREYVAGLRDASIEIEGYADYALEYASGFASFESIMRSTLGVSDTVITIAATDGTVGSPAIFGKTVEGSFGVGGSVGDVTNLATAHMVTGMLTGGVVLESGTTARTSSGNGTAVQVDNVDTGQYLYASLHVLSVSGTSPSLTVALQSDDNAGMSSATTRATFSAATSIGAQYRTPVAGPLGGGTETYWRASWTISGTSPSFTFAVALAVA